MSDTLKFNDVEIIRLGHAGFKIVSASNVIYVDPFKIKQARHGGIADFILITHDHFDHCSAEDINKISSEKTKIIAPASCSSKLSNISAEEFIAVEPDQKLSFSNVFIETVTAYNIGKNYHAKASGFVGFIININGLKIYHAGDTDLIPEMKKIKADIALLPIGGTYTMNAEEAVEAVKLINPKIAIPMHYGDVVGNKEDAEKFKKLAEDKNIKVEILEG